MMYSFSQHRQYYGRYHAVICGIVFGRENVGTCGT